MPFFRKKPVVIEAVQLTEDLAVSCLIDEKPAPFGLHFCGDYHRGRREVYRAWTTIRTLDGYGYMRVDLGDWIIKGVKGELYPCKPDIFAAAYETVEPLSIGKESNHPAISGPPTREHHE